MATTTPVVEAQRAPIDPAAVPLRAVWQLIGTPLLVVLEWHMVWAAASGMEIVLFVFLALALVERSLAVNLTGKLRMSEFVSVGVISGLLALTRPEGAVLAVLVGLGLVLALARDPARGGQTALINRAMALVAFGLAFAIVVVPYLVLNYQTSGTLLPNTFYAKGAEYAALTSH